MKKDNDGDPFQRGLDSHDFGNKPPREPDPETVTDDEFEAFEAEREGHDSRSDYDDDGEFVGNN